MSSVPSEEPPNRGDPDQYPILLPVDEHVHEHNPERRFVLVSNSSDLSSDASGSEEKSTWRRRSAERRAEPDPEPASYEANTGRKYGSPPDREDKTSGKETRPETDFRRNRPGDLPPIITDSGNGGRSHDARRARSTATDGRGEDYFSPRLSSASSRVPRERLLTPEVIEHSTNGRDRPYYRGGSSPGPQSHDRSTRPSDQHNQNPANDRKFKERTSKSAHSYSPALHKRRTSEVPNYTRRGSKESYESSRQVVDGPSSKSSRKGPSSTNSQSGLDSDSQHSSTTRDTMAPPSYNETFYSSEDEARLRLNARGERPDMPTGKTEYLSTPVESWSVGRQKSGGQSPLRSPQLPQNSLSDPYSSSASSRSATFPRESIPSRDDDYAGRALPRSPAPLPPRSGAILDSRAHSSIPSTSIPTHQIWPPPKFEPPQSSTDSNPPISSYRRYSTEVKTGELPDIPHCPRTREEVGHMDWLTLPRCDNFNICPSCYNANFAPTEFANDFVLMPFRPRDRPLACDFGASEFYRIAWLFTRKYRRPDLGLFHSLTKIAAQSQPCTGHREVSRIWHSIRDPTTRRPIDGFTVCDSCATTIEILLPGLTGLFVPLDSPAELTRSVCAMHHDRGHDRGRFLLYFDVLEGEADRALETQTAPNVQALADRIRQLAVIPPCQEGRTVSHGNWHTMRKVPILVCPECFMMVVQPLLDSSKDLTVAGQFHHETVPLDNAECMLFSDRMRNVLNRAVMKRDISYLQGKIDERIRRKEEYENRLEALQRRGLGNPWAEAEIERVVREWKRFE